MLFAYSYSSALFESFDYTYHYAEWGTTKT
jgi:hypothetical protein